MLFAVLFALSLIDGESLAGWQITGDASWSNGQGVITASGEGDGFLLSRAEFSDFRLLVEFRVDAEVNSGVFIRCTDRHRISPDTCLEINIWDDHPQQEARTGAIVFRAMPPLRRVNTVGRWSSLDILADGARLEVRINGELTATLDNAELRDGFLALQRWQGGVVQFRKIFLTRLEK